MLTILVVLSFLGIIYGVISFAQSTLKNEFILPRGKSVLMTSVICFLLFISINTTLYKLSGQEVGVVITPAGVSDDELQPGWNFVMPWNVVKLMDKTIWVYSLTTSVKEGAKPNNDAIWAPTSDGIKMGFDISVNWKIDPTKASLIYSSISADQDVDGKYHWIEDNIIRPAIKSVLPLTISQYTPIDCYSDKRSEIQIKVFELLKKDLAKNNLIVDAVQIREVFYNLQYEEAINQKKLEEQKVLTMVQQTKQKEESLKQAKIDKDIAIQRSEGEARALQIKGNSIASNPKIIQLEWIQKWNGELPKTMLGGNEVILNLNEK